MCQDEPYQASRLVPPSCTCPHTPAHTHAHMYVHTCTRMYTAQHGCTHGRTYASTHTARCGCKPACTHGRLHPWAHSRTHARDANCLGTNGRSGRVGPCDSQLCRRAVLPPFPWLCCRFSHGCAAADAELYIDGAGRCSPFMSFSPLLTKHAARDLPGIAHIDGTARVQVSRSLASYVSNGTSLLCI